MKRELHTAQRADVGRFHPLAPGGSEGADATDDTQAALRPAVFIEKDGTLLEDPPCNADPERMRFTCHAIEALRLLDAFDYVLVVVSNQPGNALGHLSPARGESAVPHSLSGRGSEGEGTAAAWSASRAAADVAPASEPAMAPNSRRTEDPALR